MTPQMYDTLLRAIGLTHCLVYDKAHLIEEFDEGVPPMSPGDFKDCGRSTGWHYKRPGQFSLAVRVRTI